MEDEQVYVYFNPNPVARNVEDCAVRAVAKALGVGWEKAYALLVANGFRMGDMPHSNSVVGSVLRQNGFYRASIPNSCPDCYTAEQFANDHGDGIFVLGFGHHVATVKDGKLYDSWNSSQEIPQYFWYKMEE